MVDASELFLKNLAGISDPEEKRRRIGHTFIDVFEAEARKVGPDVGFLVQGTLYPDVIESVSPTGGRRSRSRPTTTSAGCPSGCRSS